MAVLLWPERKDHKRSAAMSRFLHQKLIYSNVSNFRLYTTTNQDFVGKIFAITSLL